MEQAAASGESSPPGRRTSARIGLWLGPALMVVALLAAWRWAEPGDEAGWRVAGLAAWMAVWWATEALPLGVTGLLPIIMVPLLGAGTIAQATSPFGSSVIFLFLGGFLLAAAVQRWRLHERIAYQTAGIVGLAPARIVGGFMLATAVLSMWMSNTAAVLLMLPMGVSITELIAQDHPERQRFGRGLMLGIAYAASIGGLGTLIGTPPNAFLAGYARDELGIRIGFAQWMAWVVPLVAVGLVLTWLLLTRVLFRISMPEVAGGAPLVRARLDALGAPSSAERRVAAVFAAVAIAWLAAPLAQDAGLAWPDDAAIAIVGAVLLFVIPAGRRVAQSGALAGGPSAPDAARDSRRPPADDGQGARPLLVWAEAVRIPWGVLLLFGGGLSLAAAMDRTGLAGEIGVWLADATGGSLLLLVAGAALLSLVLTEFMSNTAATAILLPVLASVAAETGTDALVVLLPAALMASCGFMMPAGTPPNAVAVGSGHVEARVMVRAGIWVNLLFLVLVVSHAMIMARFVW